MRRELKVPGAALNRYRRSRHKAYPDEKGTERSLPILISALQGACHKAYPDEKGTERQFHQEKEEYHKQVTRHIPMRRELKGDFRILEFVSIEFVTRHIPMRRELKV